MSTTMSTTDDSDVLDLFSTNTTAWLSTTGSQIFFMQLGFLCYEVGFVKAVWTQSIILKNIEDTFVGVLTFLAFGYTLSESSQSFYGIISIPTNPLLIGVDIKYHDQILISAFFASTCATIISGAVLERMKNKAYIVWCMLIILVDYSFVAHWAWHEDGWLNKLGFVDGAGSVVVHSTAGMAAFVAIWNLGPRKESINNRYDPTSNESVDKVVESENKLAPVEHAARPIINAMGAFFLWYGWFAFNVSSPIAFSKGIGDSIGTTALVTVISPICASCSAFVWMWFGWVKLSFESLLSCLLCGLVAITGMCHTCNIWEAAVVGFLASPIFFVSSHYVRFKWNLDDPLQIIAIHLFCGVYSCIGEGIVANDVYGTPGLIRGGFRHFGVQLLGVFAVVAFNAIVCLLLWHLILAKAIFAGTEQIRVSILDIYLGTRLFDQNYDMALDEVLNCESNAGKKMLWQFHRYIADRYASEQLDFLIVVKIYNNYLEHSNKIEERAEVLQVKTARYLLMIIDTYVSHKASQCINISGTKRSILMKIRSQLVYELRTAKDMSKNGPKKESVALQSLPRQIGTGTEHKNDSDEIETLEGIWKDTATPNMTPVGANKSGSITSYQTGYYKSGIDITKEKLFNSVYCSVWKIVMPHFTQFLRHSYVADTKNKYEVKIPFKLEKNWVIAWDEQLAKDTENMKLANTIPQYNNSGTLLSKLVDDSKLSNPNNSSRRGSRRLSGINQIQLSEIIDKDEKGTMATREEEKGPIIFVKGDENHKKEVSKNTQVAVVIE